jgi:pSer/pThr/pTyr-binding forkhead associated (FHA) protein
MSARLVPINPKAAEPVLVQRPVMLVGRHPDCDVRLDLPAVSRRHCCLALAYERLVIRDLGSRHGVLVNGLVVDETELHQGDEIAIGPVLFRVDGLEAPQPVVPPQAPEPLPKPSSLPSLPVDPNDPDLDLLPLF